MDKVIVLSPAVEFAITLVVPVDPLNVIPVLPMIAVFKVGEVKVLLVRVCESEVPTMSPVGAVTKDAVPVVNFKIPEEELKFIPVPP